MRDYTCQHAQGFTLGLVTCIFGGPPAEMLRCQDCELLQEEWFQYLHWSFEERVYQEIADLRQFALQRTRREMQWQRIHADDYFENRFGYYAETKLETLKHYAPLRRRQKRDGLAVRFPGVGFGFDKALAQLATKRTIPCELCLTSDRDFCGCYCEDCGKLECACA